MLPTPSSHLLQMRGLKLLLWILQLFFNVASFTDAWIETKRRIMQARRREVASFTDAWIETHQSHVHDVQTLVASFTDAWIETR